MQKIIGGTETGFDGVGTTVTERILINQQKLAKASEEIVLSVLGQLQNGKIDDAIAGFAEDFTFKDHGIGLEFTTKERLGEFLKKTRELHPDSMMSTDKVLLNGDHVIIEWTLRFTLKEIFIGSLSQEIRVLVHGASLVRTDDGKIIDWSDYYDGLTSRRTGLASYFTKWVEL